MIRPFSASTETTWRLSVVTLSTAQMTRHLLAGEGAAGILTVTGRTKAAVGHRHAVSRTQTTEVPALHAAGEPLPMVTPVTSTDWPGRRNGPP